MDHAKVQVVTSLSLVGPSHGWAFCGGDGALGSAAQAVFETTNAGTAWTLRWKAWSADPGGAQFLADGHGWLWSFAFTKFRATLNGGRTWKGLAGAAGPASGATLSAWFVSHRIGLRDGP